MMNETDEVTVHPVFYLDEIGNLSELSPEEEGHYFKVHDLTLEAHEPVNFYVRSNDFSPLLKLYFGDELVTEAAGEPVINKVTGKAGFWKVSIVHRASSAGPYRALVTTFEAYRTGDYSLSATGAFSK